MIYPICVFVRKKKVVATWTKYDGTKSVSYAYYLEKIADCNSDADIKAVRNSLPSYGPHDINKKYDFFHGNFVFIDLFGKKLNPEYVSSILYPVIWGGIKNKRKFVFRNGPVPGLKGRWRRSGGIYRHIRTSQEINANIALDDYSKEISEEYGIPIKGKRRNLPTYWDDICRDKNSKSWKRFRKNQWKVK